MVRLRGGFVFLVGTLLFEGFRRSSFSVALLNILFGHDVPSHSVTVTDLREPTPSCCGQSERVQGT